MSYVRISELIKELEKIKNEKGDLVCCLNDDHNGFVPSLGVFVHKTEGERPDGLFSHKPGDEKVCVIAFTC